jgi:hypothetical protein
MKGVLIERALLGLSYFPFGKRAETLRLIFLVCQYNAAAAHAVLARRQGTMFGHLFVQSDDFRIAWQFADRCLDFFPGER